MILELEAKTDAGIGELFRRAVANHYRFREITETIRLALIGGCAAPVEAARLVTAYVEADGRPFAEAHALALDILSHFYVGDQPAAPEPTA
jgi:hypothetical protein